MTRTRIFLADDHALVTEGIRKLLEDEFELVGTATDGRALLAGVEALKPDLVLVDISLPSLNGLDAARQLKKVVPDANVIFLTMHADQGFVTEAFRAGASGYVVKQSAASELLFAIQEVLKGRTYVSPIVAKDLVARAVNPGDGGATRSFASRLTARQREVVQLIAEGRSTKEIAGVLKVSTKTVEFHKTRIMQQLGVHSTAELTKYALAHGLVSL